MVLESGTLTTFKVVLEPIEEGGYTAHVPSLPGCIREGETVEEAMARIREAVEVYLEPVEGLGAAGARRGSGDGALSAFPSQKSTQKPLWVDGIKSSKDRTSPWGPFKHGMYC